MIKDYAHSLHTAHVSSSRSHTPIHDTHTPGARERGRQRHARDPGGGAADQRRGGGRRGARRRDGRGRGGRGGQVGCQRRLARRGGRGEPGAGGGVALCFSYLGRLAERWGLCGRQGAGATLQLCSPAQHFELRFIDSLLPYLKHVAPRHLPPGPLQGHNRDQQRAQRVNRRPCAHTGDSRRAIAFNLLLFTLSACAAAEPGGLNLRAAACSLQLL